MKRTLTNQIGLMILMLCQLSVLAQWKAIHTVGLEPFEFYPVDHKTVYLSGLTGMAKSTDNWGGNTSCLSNHFVSDYGVIGDSIIYGIGMNLLTADRVVFWGNTQCNQWAFDSINQYYGGWVINFHEDHFYFNIGVGWLLKQNTLTNKEDSIELDEPVSVKHLSTRLGSQFLTGIKGNLNPRYFIYKEENGRFQRKFEGPRGARFIRSVKDVLYGFGAKATLLVSKDSGDTWQLIPTPATEELVLTNGWFTSPDTGYISGGTTHKKSVGFVYRTFDGGKTWTNISPTQKVQINDIYFINDSTGFCVDNNGVIYKTTNRGGDAVPDSTQQDTGTVSVAESIPSTVPQLQLFPNPTRDRITLVTSGITEPLQLVVMDSRGKIVREQLVTDTTTRVNLAPLARGVYYLQLYSNEVRFFRKVLRE